MASVRVGDWRTIEGRTEINHKRRWSIATALLALGLSAGAQAQQGEMSFFVTSAGPGKGADLGGLEGADRHCQALAQAAGAGDRTWRAYLSTQARGRRGASTPATASATVPGRTPRAW